MKRIAALVPNILGTSPGQRVRIELWAQHLRQVGWEVDFYPFEDGPLHEVLYRPGRLLTKAIRMLACYLRQLSIVLQRLPCDILFIYREVSLIGPALLERLASRGRIPVVYDLDDPAFIPYRSPANGRFSFLKFSAGKTRSLIRLSDHVIAINHLIGDYASSLNPNVSVLPNFVDAEQFCPGEKPVLGPVRLVWTGSHSSAQNLRSIVNPLRRVQARHPVPLRVIGAGDVELPGVQLEPRPWSAHTEIAGLQECHIGLVPLMDHPWNPWKFFLKAIQYMAVGLPVVARRMGSNGEVIQDGVNGFLVDTEDEWHDRICLLIEDAPLRERMGAAARQTVVERYSTQAQIPVMASIFDRVLRRSARGRRSHKP